MNQARKSYFKTHEYKSKIRFLEQIETTKHYVAFCIETYFINPSILVGAMPIQGKLMNCEGDLSSFKWKTHHKIGRDKTDLRHLSMERPTFGGAGKFEAWAFPVHKYYS